MSPASLPSLRPLILGPAHLSTLKYGLESSPRGPALVKASCLICLQIKLSPDKRPLPPWGSLSPSPVGSARVTVPLASYSRLVAPSGTCTQHSCGSINALSKLPSAGGAQWTDTTAWDKWSFLLKSPSELPTPETVQRAQCPLLLLGCPPSTPRPVPCKPETFLFFSSRNQKSHFEPNSSKYSTVLDITLKWLVTCLSS